MALPVIALGGCEGTMSPVPVDASPAVKDGARIFQALCAGCHFADRAETKVAPGLAGILRPNGPGPSRRTLQEVEIRLILRRGTQGMPAFSYLNPRELDNLMAYLKTL